MRRYFRSCAIIGVFFNGALQAQTAPPDIGTTLREMEQERPVTAPPPAPSLDIEQPARTPSESAPETPFLVAQIRVTGSTAYPASRLEALVSRFSGRTVSLAELREAAATITRFYRDRGYPLARAFVPSQTIRDGVVEIAVLEGKYGKLRVQDDAGVSESLVRNTLRAAVNSNVIRSAPLERELLLLQELQGVASSATLSPGEQVGTADLIVHLTPEKRYQWTLDADNSGNRYTGPLRAGFGFVAANLAGRGDQLAMRGVFTNEKGVIYGRAGYQMPVGSLRMGAALTRTDYVLGKQFTSLDAHGSATASTLYALYPLIRSLAGSLDTQLAFSYADLSDMVGATATTDRRWSREVTLSVNGSVRDDFLAGGITTASVGYINGHLRIRDLTAWQIDQATARTAGTYDKLSYTALHLQSLGRALPDLYIAVSGQIAGKNLDPSEKFALGGPNAVRSYPQGEGVGDNGLLGTLELRHALPDVGAFARPQLIAFFDGGRIYTNKNAFLPGENVRSLFGTGVGFNLFTRNGFTMRACWAWKIGAQPVLSDTDSSSRGWIQLGMNF
ncbi:MAG: ShlB/FhaC/HecB family hemolysin secretion/activation protein [Steroidobacteraceae bacterium]